MNRADCFILILMEQFLVRLISYSLTFKCWETTAVLLLVNIANHQNSHCKYFVYSFNSVQDVFDGDGGKRGSKRTSTSFSPVDSSKGGMIPGHMPNGHFPDGLFSNVHFPDRHFPDQTHPRWTLSHRGCVWSGKCLYQHAKNQIISSVRF